MRSLGLDLGSVTCGVAISDPMGIVARSYETVRFQPDDYEACLQRILEILRLEQPGEIVLGFPKHMHETFIEPSRRYADIIIPEGGQNSVAIDLLTTKISSILHHPMV